jgi:uncharacterized protein (DUF488 family)
MKIFTIGYERSAIDQFVGFLVKQKIKILVDVRRNPLSRKPGFSKTKLAENLAKKKIEYVHFKSLGVPSSWRKQAKHKIITREKMFEDYAKKILPEATNELQKIKEMAAKKRLVILCYEADATDCHRRRITNKLKSKKIQISDLKLDKK